MWFNFNITNHGSVCFEDLTEFVLVEGDCIFCFTHQYQNVNMGVYVLFPLNVLKTVPQKVI